jgi:tetratricopeptide (TPR) repeat protein
LDTRVTAYQGLGDLNRAIADWEEAMRLDPDDADYKKNLIKAHAMKDAQDAGKRE